MLRGVIENGGSESIEEVLQAIESTDAIAYTARLAADEAAIAKQALDALPASRFRNALAAVGISQSIDPSDVWQTGIANRSGGCDTGNASNWGVRRLGQRRPAVTFRSVAQLGRAPRSGRGGRRFESFHPTKSDATAALAAALFLHTATYFPGISVGTDRDFHP